MAIQSATFSGTNGQAATAGNTGMSSIVVTGGSMAFDSVWSPRGVVAVKSTATAANGSVYAYHGFAATSGVAYELPMKPLAWPSASTESFLRISSGGGATRGIEVQVGSDGSIIVRDGPFAVAWSAPAGSMTIGVGCIVSLFVGVGTSAGLIRIVIYGEDEVTVRFDSGMLSGKNTGSAQLDGARTLGAKVGTSTRTAQYLFGAPRWDVAASNVMPTLAPPAAHRPFKMWIGGAYVPVNLRRWSGSGYELLG